MCPPGPAAGGVLASATSCLKTTSDSRRLSQLCAAATLVSLAVLVAGWVAQNKLVRGLSTGAIK